MTSPEIESGRVNFSSSRRAKAYLQNVYGRYALGKDDFPKKRLSSPVEDLGRSARPFAALLNKAWERIDTDRDYFWDMMELSMAKLSDSGKESASALVIATWGLNAVNFGQVSVVGEDTRAVYGTFTPNEAQELANSLGMTASDGHEIKFVDGDLRTQAIPDAVIIRPGSVSSHFDGLARAA